ncbi:AMP-binding protein [Chlorogloeopsis fritschii PCC 9212]|uniref:AMP-dependent synthetase n=1 Tax=Chlorogloeopsis fritschii PCC 6912 TaxID=211165 RepID=A0A433MWP3_CHLFR|nr:AMP-binding protein [Chlorogloeopsis fritschii]RUR72403.1 AMP-dependent synthetase [Chlorogloeopsis fritschii PCC 6912]
MSKQLSLEQLLNCGLETNIASAILPQVNQWLASLPATHCWQYLVQYILKSCHPFALHELLYKTTFSDWDINQGQPPAWFPSPEQIQATNIAALMKELKLDSYAELHAWSAQHRAEFWEMMIKRLGICLQKSYTQIVDLSQGVELPQWLVGARLNITDSCFQAPADNPAIIFQPEGGALTTWTYGELQALTNRVANGLVEAGFVPGDAIAIAMPMTAESVAIYLGIVKAGCVVVSIADSFAADEIATRLRISKAKAIFTQDYIRRGGKQLPLYAKVVDAKTPRAIVLASSPSITLRLGDLTWEKFLSSNEKFDAFSAHPTAYTNILFSSGTTAEPKAIPWTQTTPIKCASDGHLHHDIHPQDVVAWPTNLGWMMGPWLIYASLVNKATIALYYGAPTERGFGEFIQDARVTMLGLVPSLVSNWKTTACMQGFDWSAIKAFSSTGECSNPQDILFLMSLAGYKPIVEYCGGTEIGGAYITGTVVQPAIPSTFTTPALGLDFVILDEEGHLADKGEAFIVPPSIGLSTELLNKDHHQVYFANAPSLGQALRCHGDQIEQLPNGYYRALGRVDDTMNLSGIKVSSTEIEQILNTVEGICETAAIAISPPEGGPSLLIIYAVVESNVKADKEALKASLQTAIKQRLNPLFKIHDVVIVESLPRTASNKVMRRVLRDRYKVAESVNG